VRRCGGAATVGTTTFTAFTPRTGASRAVAWALDTNASGTETGGAGGTGVAILRAYDAISFGTALQMTVYGLLP
jgi:hypothetical protein